VVANILKLIKLIELVPVLPFRNVNNNRHYTNIENLVGYIDRIIEIRLSGTFIAMDENPMSTTELVLSISKLLNRKILLFSLPGFVVKIGVFLMPGIFDRLFNSFYLDNSKTRLSLNYVPPFSPNEGLMKMISYYKSVKRRENGLMHRTRRYRKTEK
jgi:nucleoside-diphosphate-sugar epimerase